MADHSRIDDLRRRVQKDPASIAFAQLAEECRRAGEYQEAVDICRAGLAIHPAYLSARVTLGRALVELNQLDEAQGELTRVLGSAPENLTAIRGLAEIHHRRGDLAQALAQYRAALALAPNDPDLEQTVSDLSREVEPKPAPASGLTLDQVKHELLKHAPPPMASAPQVAPPPPTPADTAATAAPSKGEPPHSPESTQSTQSSISSAISADSAVDVAPALPKRAETAISADSAVSVVPPPEASVREVAPPPPLQSFESGQRTPGSVDSAISPDSAVDVAPPPPTPAETATAPQVAPPPPGPSETAATAALTEGEAPNSPQSTHSTQSSISFAISADSAVDVAPTPPKRAETAISADSAVSVVPPPEASVPEVAPPPPLQSFESGQRTPGSVDSAISPNSAVSVVPPPEASLPEVAPPAPQQSPENAQCTSSAISADSVANVVPPAGDTLTVALADRATRTIAALEQWLAAIHVARAQRST